MDHVAFDRLARLLGRATTRRAGLGAGFGLAAALGLGAGASAAAPRFRGAPGSQGPCGNRKRKDNTCREDSQCCTGYCKKGLKNKDGKGRCRCAPKNHPCTKKTLCCKRFSCVDGVCQVPVVCDVCPKGCQYSTVEAAWAAAPDGGTIAVGAGVYPTHIMVDKSMTVTACDGASADQVVLSYVPDSGYLAIFEDPDVADHTLNLIGITLDGEGADSYGGVLGQSHLVTNASGCTFRNGYSGINVYTVAPGPTTIVDCRFDQFTGTGLELRGGAITVTGCTFTTPLTPTQAVAMAEADSIAVSNCTFTLNGRAISSQATGPITISACVSTGGSMIVNSPAGLVTGCSITGATSTNGGGILVSAGALTIEQTTISGCSATNYGGGIAVQAVIANATATLGQGVVVTGNTAPEGSGIAAVSAGATATVIGASTSNVYGNLVGDPCETSTDYTTWVPVANCSF